MTDTASNVGPRFPPGALTGNFPHVVPEVPAPKFSPTAGPEVDCVEEEDEAGETAATGRADEVLEEVSPVGDERASDVADEAEEVGEAEASDAEDRTLGQKVLLKVCTSDHDHC